MSSGKNQGRVCFFCKRVFEARYESKGHTVSSLERAMGTSSDLHAQFMQYWEDCTKQCIVAGGAHVAINWREMGERVAMADIKEVEICQPKDTCLSLADYKAKHGDPNTNGRNHNQCVFQGFDAVCVPGPREWTVRKKSIHQAQKSRTVDDGSFQVGAGQLDDNFASLSAMLFAAFPSGVGVSLDMLLPSTGATPTAPASSSSAPMATAAARSGEGNDEDDEFLVTPLWAMAGPNATPVVGARPSPSKAEPKAKARRAEKAEAQHPPSRSQALRELQQVAPASLRMSPCRQAALASAVARSA